MASPAAPSSQSPDGRGQYAAVVLQGDDDALAARDKGGIAGALREPGTLQRLLCASVAWTVTVAPVGFSVFATTSAHLLAVVALASAIVGPALAVRYRQSGRHIGISLFLAASAATWLLTPQAINPARADTIRAAIGAIAWGVYALSWGEPWTAFGAVERKQEQDPLAAPLRARARLAPFAVPIATVGVVAAMVAMLTAWQVRDPSRAVIAQALGVAVSVALVTASATLAVSRGKARAASDRKVTSAVVRALVLLVGVAVLGAVLLALRG